MQGKDNPSLLAVIVYWVGIITSMMTYSQQLYATPTGGTVVEGGATIGTNALNPNHQIITQTTPRAVINWSSFNIDVHQMTEFRQPSADAIALNRVVGGDPSVIMGSLKANGQVWLVNPAGVFFGPTSRVDVAGLLVTTADIRNSDFMKGNYLFTQPENRFTSVINEGQITIANSGIAYLVAPGVRNSGVIRANLGKVVLASGTQYTVDLYGDGLIHFATNLPAMTEKPKTHNGEVMNDAVRNSGEILTDGGKVLLTTSDAKQVVENLINMDGVIKAQTAVVKKGEIYLYGAAKGVVKVTGTIEAKGHKPGEKGGKVTITGDKVGLLAAKNNEGRLIGPSIDVSGHAGGGEIFAGGDYQGKGLIPHADAIFVAKESTLLANAMTQGDGGKIIVWSDNATRFYGTAQAKGGPLGGNGGLVETSAKWVDMYGAKIDASSPKGLSGTWLLDPFNVTIGDFGASSNGAFADDAGTQVWTPTASPSVISPGDVQAFLDAGTSVRITTTGGGAEAGNIQVDVLGSMQKTAGGAATLTLQADNNINLDGSIIDNVGNLTLVLNAIGAATTGGASTITVAAMSLGTNSAAIGNGGSTVAGSTTGSNITFDFTFRGGQGTGPWTFNGNPLTPGGGGGGGGGGGSGPTGGTITSVLAPGNFTGTTGTGTTGGTGTGSTSSTSSTSDNIEVQNQQQQPAQQTTEQQTTSTSTETTTTSTSSTETTTTQTTTTETTTTSETSSGTTTTDTTTTTTTETTVTDTSGAPSGTADTTADAPSSGDAIGGGAQETATTAEQRGGAETTTVDPDSTDMTDTGGRSQDPNFSPEYNDALQDTGPVNANDLATDAPGLSDSATAEADSTLPVAPDLPGDGIIGADLGQELIESAEGAEGQEGVVDASGFDPNQAIDRSHDDRERTLKSVKPKIPTASDLINAAH